MGPLGDRVGLTIDEQGEFGLIELGCHRRRSRYYTVLS
jgi:hypothetical protein